ncbi:MAG: hypothetical protein KY461_12945, partial [Actinobacteria bacterium]|nr:hypothetical protein [Actinomycetota bacterium]
DEALEILVENDDVLETMAERLLDEETLDAAALAEIMAKVRQRPSRAVAAPHDKTPASVLRTLRRLNGSGSGSGNGNGSAKQRTSARETPAKKATTPKKATKRSSSKRSD